MQFTQKDLRQIADYQAKYDALEIHRGAAVEATVNRIFKGKDRYQAVEKLTGVPWVLIGVLHDREASCNFNGCLANGQNFRRRTTIEPVGVGPWPSWEASAVWALQHDKLTEVTDWTPGVMLERAEAFNGEGYWNHGWENPYLFGGSQFYHRGKYVRDRVYDPSKVDPQVGVACVLKRLQEIDSGNFVSVAIRSMTGSKKLHPVDKKAVVQNSRALTWTQWYQDFCHYAGLSLAGLWTVFKEVQPYVTDWRTLTVLGILGGGYIASKIGAFNLMQAAAEGRYVPSGFFKITMKAADGEHVSAGPTSTSGEAAPVPDDPVAATVEQTAPGLASAVGA